MPISHRSRSSSRLVPLHKYGLWFNGRGVLHWIWLPSPSPPLTPLNKTSTKARKKKSRQCKLRQMEFLVRQTREERKRHWFRRAFRKIILILNDIWWYIIQLSIELMDPLQKQRSRKEVEWVSSKGRALDELQVYAAGVWGRFLVKYINKRVGGR